MTPVFHPAAIRDQRLLSRMNASANRNALGVKKTALEHLLVASEYITPSETMRLRAEIADVGAAPLNGNA